MGRFVSYPRRRSAQQPKVGTFVSDYRDDYDEGAGGIRLHPARLGSIFRRANAGDTAGMYEVFEVVEQDPHVLSVLGKRRRRVLSRTLQISASEDSDRGQKAADLARTVILGGDGRDGIAQWHAALRDLTDAIFRGFSLLQIVWADRDGFWQPEALKYWPQRFCQLGDPLALYDTADVDEVRVITAADLVKGEALAPDQWICHKAKARSGPLARAALGRAVAWFYLFKHFSIRDWSIFVERYGLPIRKGTYPVGSDDKERTALRDALASIGKDGFCAVPEGTTIELIEARMSARHPHREMADFCNAEISKVIEGGTLTTEAGERGARSLGIVHQDEQSAITDEDCSQLADTLRRELIAPIVRFNGAAGWPVPTVEFLEDEDEDFKAMAETDSILVNEIGLPLSEDYFYQRYDRPRPEEGQEVVRGKPATPPAMIDDETDEQAREEAETEAAAATGLSRAAVRALAREPRVLFELAAQKKRSRGWAR